MIEAEWWEYDSLDELADAVAGDVGFIVESAVDARDARAIADLGVSIEFVRSDSVWGFASPSVLKRVRSAGVAVMGDFDFAVGRGGHEGVAALDFPSKDARFHNYAETLAALQALNAANPDITKV